MPRAARTVFAHLPHHITQRGNKREDVFFDDEDRTTCLEWLGGYAAKSGVEVAGYCLMCNHIHLILIPSTEDGLQQVLKPLHRRHAQRLNRALRHVERNPVRARIGPKAGSYPWSSARGHCGLAKDALLATKPSWRGDLSDMASWSQWLSEPDGEEALLALRRNAMMGLPCGGKKFIRKMERLAGRPLRVRPRGRPRRSGSNEQP